MNDNPNSQLDPQDPSSEGARIDSQEQPYDGFEGCWPGDGSGMDDLADLNQNEAMDYCDEQD